MYLQSPRQVRDSRRFHSELLLSSKGPERHAPSCCRATVPRDRQGIASPGTLGGRADGAGDWLRQQHKMAATGESDTTSTLAGRRKRIAGPAPVRQPQGTEQVIENGSQPLLFIKTTQAEPSTLRWLVTECTPSIPLATTPARTFSDSLPTTPSSTTSPLLTMM